MTIKLGIIMDPISKIKIAKDTTFAMLLEAQKRQYEIYYFETKDLYVNNGKSYGNAQKLTVTDNEKNWFSLSDAQTIPLASLDVMLMRKDPPFNMEFIYCTYILELAEKEGSLVINKPASLRDANEKMFTSWFPQCCPPTLVTSNAELIKQFAHEHQDIIIKPLDGMGGESVLRLTPHDANLSVGIELLTAHGQKHIMAQQYIPEIKAGDKRILIVHGKPIPIALARIAKPGETRANLAAGGHGVTQPLSERDQWICQQVADKLVEKGLLFVGLDVIGDYLTEINVTSPTCARAIQSACDIDIMSQFFKGIEQRL